MNYPSKMRSQLTESGFEEFEAIHKRIVQKIGWLMQAALENDKGDIEMLEKIEFLLDYCDACENKGCHGPNELGGFEACPFCEHGEKWEADMKAEHAIQQAMDADARDSRNDEE